MTTLKAIRTTKNVAAAVFMAGIVLTIGLGAVSQFMAGYWIQGTASLAAALFLASRE